jgi:hypothetical protein
MRDAGATMTLIGRDERVITPEPPPDAARTAGADQAR